MADRHSDFLTFATTFNANVMSQALYEAAPWVPTGFVKGIAPSAYLNKVWRQSSYVVASLMALIPKILDEDTFDDGNRVFTSDQIERLIGMTARIYAAVQEGPLDGRVYGRTSCPPCEYPASFPPGTAGWTAVPPEAPASDTNWYVRRAGEWGNLYDILRSWDFIQDSPGSSWYARSYGQWGDLPNYLLPVWGYFTDAPPGAWYVRTQGSWGDLFGYLLPAYGYFTDAPGGDWFVRTAGGWGSISMFGFDTVSRVEQRISDVQNWANGTFSTPGWVEAWVSANFVSSAGGGGGTIASIPGTGGNAITSVELVWATMSLPINPILDDSYSGQHEPWGRLCGWAMLFRGSGGQQWMNGVPSNWPSFPYDATSHIAPFWPPRRYIFMAANPSIPATNSHWVEIFSDGSFEIRSSNNGWNVAFSGGAGTANNWGPFAPGLGSNNPYPPWDGTASGIIEVSSQ
jgi:hypothetical protein